MEFGSDNKGSYTQFQHNHKQKRYIGVVVMYTVVTFSLQAKLAF